jgi:hypothetical protein
MSDNAMWFFEGRCLSWECLDVVSDAYVRHIMVLSFPTSKDCGVKFDRATKKRRRFEELGDEDLNITESTAPHCLTCKCCRPSKRLEMKSTDIEEQRAVLRNVRWALDEDRQPSPIRKKLLQRGGYDYDYNYKPDRTRPDKLLQHLDLENIQWNAPASSDYINFGLELIGAASQHPSQANPDKDEHVHAGTKLGSLRFEAVPPPLPSAFHFCAPISLSCYRLCYRRAITLDSKLTIHSQEYLL